MAKEQSDHDLLIELHTKVDILTTGQNNHLAHHSRRDVAMLSVTLSSVIAATIATITTLIIIFRT